MARPIKYNFDMEKIKKLQNKPFNMSIAEIAEKIYGCRRLTLYNFIKKNFEPVFAYIPKEDKKSGPD